MTSFQLGGPYLQSALFLAHASYAAYEENPESYKNFQNFHFDNVIPFASAKSKDNEATRGFLGCVYANLDSFLGHCYSF